jgi:hypothetical protein
VRSSCSAARSQRVMSSGCRRSWRRSLVLWIASGSQCRQCMRNPRQTTGGGTRAFVASGDRRRDLRTRGGVLDSGVRRTAAGDEVTARAAASGNAGELIDDEARRAYRARLAELREAIDDAGAMGSADRVGAMQEKMDFISRELSRALGRGGRSRHAGSIAERARLNVTRAVKSAMRRIAATDGRTLKPRFTPEPSVCIPPILDRPSQLAFAATGRCSARLNARV